MATIDTESDTEQPEMFSLLRVDEKAGKSKPYQTKILINGNEIIMEITTRSTITVINEITFSAMKNHLTLQKSNTVGLFVGYIAVDEKFCYFPEHYIFLGTTNELRNYSLVTQQRKFFICSFEYGLFLVLQDSWCLGLLDV